MQGPGAGVLLQAWEHGLDRSSTIRALTLLAAASPGTSPQQLAELSIGDRDVGLLRLRSALFGDLVEAICACPACAQPLDFAFHLEELRARVAAVDPAAGSERADGSDGSAGSAGTATRQLTIDGYHITVRAATSADLLAVAGEPDLSAARRELLWRCVADIRGEKGVPVDGALPEAVADALSTQIAELDPTARIELDLTCAACSHQWPMPFDIAGFLWTELNAWAQRTLHDVHTLARAYGWSEADILAMSPRRRQDYLELVQS